MRILVQRIKTARVIVESQQAAAIGQGLLLFVGISKDDTLNDLEYLCNKVLNLRIFPDSEGKMNLSIRQINAEILSVPQFTLYADISKGNRPGFEEAAESPVAKGLWEKFDSLLIENGVIVKRGVFGVDMQVELVNDGPLTIWLDSKKKGGGS
ncbi:MAG: D-tyrosyl-tRNA(Tyr) deacylase [Candidatus Omnitrophica bacterium]|nr:D-tyrosyl-tRNA(Tyr) deacylase [Candidatus Omnitrophota bacterium]